MVGHWLQAAWYRVERKRSAAGRTLLILCHLLFAVVGFAQQPAKDLTEASLEELSNIKVYSASRRMQNTSDAPSSVTIVTAEEIQKFGYRTLADILRQVPGFYITYDRHFSFAGVRGFGRLGDWNNRILVLVDGHRMNTNIFGHAMLGNEFPVDIDLIERVEIVLGPSSSLYGNNAFFGVINVVTRAPSQLHGWEVSFSPGSFETFSGRASYGENYKGVEMLFSNTVYGSHGQTLFFPEINSPITNNGIARNTDEEDYDHAIAEIGYKGFKFQAVFSQREKRIPTGYVGTLFNDPRTHNFDSHQYFDLTYHRTVGDAWQLELRAAYDQYRLVVAEAVASGPFGVDQFSNHGDWWSGEARISRSVWVKHQLTLGVEFRDNLHKDQGLYSSASNRLEEDLNSGWDWGLYAQDEYAITHKLTLSAGIRHDRYPRGAVIDKVTAQPPLFSALQSFGGSTNPRIGLIYHPYQKTTFKWLYGSAFRAPEVFETTPDVGPVVEDNFHLKPEKIHSFEIVAEQLFGRNFKFSANLFYNEISRLIGLQPGPNAGVQIFENSASAHATGSEISLLGKSASGVEGSLNLSFVNADYGQTGQDLNNAPGRLAKIRLSAPLQGKWLFGAMEGQYVAPRKTFWGTKVGSYQVFNVTLLAHTIGKHLDLSATLNNVLNKKYSDPARPEEPVTQIPQDGRNFRIKITGRF
jgi:outer membrane receptor protein involved in Fe transport